MKKIQLGHHLKVKKYKHPIMWVIVDDDLFDYLNQWRWSATWSPITRSFYATTGSLENKKRKTLYMHREIMNTPKGFDTDHINHDTLDNRKQNLRVATRSQNTINTPKYINNSSGFKGVSFHKGNKKWRVQITKDYNPISLGYFTDKEEAALAYNEAAKKYHGELARLNNL